MGQLAESTDPCWNTHTYTGIWARMQILAQFTQKHRGKNMGGTNIRVMLSQAINNHRTDEEIKVHLRRR